jgi:chromosome segregation ATPase
LVELNRIWSASPLSLTDRPAQIPVPSTLEDKLQKLAMATEEREFGNAKQQRDFEALLSREKALGKQLQHCGAEAESLRRELATLGGEARELREARAAARAAAAAAEQNVLLLSGRIASRDETILSLAEDVRSLKAALHEERAGRRVDAVSLAAAQGQLGVCEGQLASLRRSLQLSEAGRQEADRALAQSVQQVGALEAAAAGQRERVLQLQALLAASDEKLEQQSQAHKGQTHQLREQEGELVSRLQFQVRPPPSLH